MAAKVYKTLDGGIVRWFGDEVMRNTRQQTVRALRATGIEAVKRVRLSMGGERFTAAERQAARLTKGGKKRKISPAAPTHRPRSKPGEPPAVQTGRLVGSIGSEVNAPKLLMRFGSIKLVGGEPVDYAAYLEHGTAKMAARPYLRPQIPWALKFFQERLREEMKVI